MLDFDKEFMTDEEIEEQMNEMLDAFVDAVGGEEILEEDNKAAIINPFRLEQLKFAYMVLRYITKGQNVTVSYKLHEPFKSMGSVSVEGRQLIFDKPEWFARVAEFASNTEIYPLAKQAVRMTFTFHGLTKPIE